MKNNQPIYPVEPWCVTETKFKIENNYRNETIFALSNGYIGTRGTFEEAYAFGTDQGLEGNYMNGFFDSEPIRYGERNFGFPERSQTMLNLPNLKTTRIFLEGELFDMRTGRVEDYRRTLDLRGAMVTRRLTWTSPGGKRALIETARFVSLVSKNIMAQRIRVTPLNFEGEVRLQSMLDADVKNHTSVTNPLIDYGPYSQTLCMDSISAADDMLIYEGRTTNSGMRMACGSFHICPGEKADARYETCGQRCLVEYSFRGAATMDKVIAYASSLEMPGNELAGFVDGALRESAQEGFNTMAYKQRLYMSSFWNCADIEVDGGGAMQQGLRFNLFSIMQSAGCDGRAGMGAMGLSGEGCEGHYSWDTEIYVLPVLIYTFPDAAKALLDYRYSTLDAARDRARELGHAAGALYPWRTIDGRECSVNVPLGTAQYHINADIAYAFAQYVEVTGDNSYLKDKAAEVLCETARVWADVGCFSEARGGKYSICCVTGPDEYTAFVDNNFYTNLMARENLRDAVSAVRWLLENDGRAFEALSKKIGLRIGEPEVWSNIADNMYLPRDEAMGVYLPDDGFLLRKPWNEAKIPAGKRHSLYENFHPLFVWRHRMAKQADSILALFLHSDHFSCDDIARNYDFYQEFTLHHSPLSTCVFGIAASRIGRDDDAYRYFSESARMDLDDHNDNVSAGIHAANMAGSWQAVVFGFAGLRANAGRLELAPRLPEQWNGYSFRIVYRDALLEVSVRKNACSVSLLDGEPRGVIVHGEEKNLKKGESICVSVI